MKRKLALLIRSLRGLRQVVGIYIANLARALGLPAETTTFDSELVLPVLTEQVLQACEILPSFCSRQCIHEHILRTSPIF